MRSGRRRKKKARVPEVLWRLYKDRARTLSDTLLSLIPPSSCRCKPGRRCLSCFPDPAEFLLRNDDPKEYRKLLIKCFVVVSVEAPVMDRYSRRCGWTPRQLVHGTTELIKKEKPHSSDVLCANYNPLNRSSPFLDLLTQSSWVLLQKRVGDELMIYLLKYTSIFVPLGRRNYSQVSGSSIIDFFFKTYCKAKPTRQNSSSYLANSRKTRTRVKEADSTSEIEYGPSSIISCISCNDTPYTTSSCRITKNKNNHESLSRKAASSSGTPNYNEGENPNTDYHDNQNQVNFNPRKRRRILSGNSMICSSSCRGNTKNKEHRNTACYNDEILPKEAYQEIFNQVKIKKSQPRESSWRRKRKYLPSDMQDSNFHSQSDTNMTESKTSSRSAHSAFNARCSCCSMLLTFLNVATESQIDKWSSFYNLVHSSSTFPRKHILNKLKANLAGASALMKHIFNLSDETINSLSQPCSHITSCLKHSTCLYHSLLGLLRKLLRKVKRCQYMPLLEKHCPVQSLAPNAECNNIREKSVKLEPIPTQYYCPQKEVVSFIWAVCRNIIPPNLLGTKSCWRLLRRNISRFICQRRFEAFSLHQGMHNLKLSMFPFLSDRHSLCMNKNIQSCIKLRYNIMKKWIFRLFTMLVVPLLQTHFYVTESEHGKQDIFYYRKPIWRDIMDNTATQLKDQNHCRPVDEEYVRRTSRKRSFGFSKVRLLPKGKSFRVLVNLTARSRLPHTRLQVYTPKVNYEHFKSVNSVLYDLHAVLKGIQFREPDKLGSSVFNYTEMYKKLCQFLLSLKNGSTSMPTVYIVVADVSKAFDSVDQDKLLEIMEGLIQNDGYILKKCQHVTCKKKSLWVDHNLYLAEKDSVNELSKFSSSLPGVSVNQGWSRNIRKEELQFILKEHVKRNILKLGGQYYLQCVGIPQGSILSPLLYSFYYGHLEKTVLLPLIQKASAGNLSDNKSLLVRFTDDFLFISTSKEHASNFFLRLSEGFPGYNCTMNQMKFGRNFDIDKITERCTNTMYVDHDGNSFLRWSGLFINCRTLEIQADYVRCLNNHVSSTLTICWGNNPKLRLKAKLCDYLRPKSHPIFYNSNINSSVVVRLNFYQAFLLTAMKFHCYYCELSTVCRLDVNYCFVILESSLRFMHKCVKKRMFSTCLETSRRPNFQVERNEVEWLGIKAYIRILQKKQTRYKELLSMLKSKLKSQEKVMLVSSHLLEAVDDLLSSVIWKIKY